MLRISNEQMAELGRTFADKQRPDLIKAYEAEGFQVEEDVKTGDLILKDAAGGVQRVRAEAMAVEVETGEGRRFRREMDYQGRLTALTDPAGFRIAYQYNRKGLLEEIRRGEHSSYRFEYDGGGKLAAIVYPDGSRHEYQRDAKGRLQGFRNGNGHTRSYEYSEEGLLTGLRDFGGAETRLDNRKFNLQKEVRLPTGVKKRYYFDPDSRPLRIDVNGRMHVEFEYDEAPGELWLKYADGETTKLAFAKERLMKAANNQGAVEYEYDGGGHLVGETAGECRVEYRRNALGVLTGLSHAAGYEVAYELDGEHRPVGVRWGGKEGGEAIQIKYHLNGALLDIRYPNGTVSRFTPDAIGLPRSMRLEHRDGQVLGQASWEYDVYDRLIREQWSDQRREYAYDAEGRLLAVRSDARKDGEQFELDPNGNAVAGPAGKCEFNGGNQLIKCGGSEFNYDPRGNMARGMLPEGAGELTFNGEGRLIWVECGKRLVRYAYDGLGRRTLKQAGDRLTRYMWAGRRLIGEATEEGGREIGRRWYVYYPNSPVVLAMVENGTVYYMHPGRRSETWCMTDAAGEVVWKTDYTAFGATRGMKGKVAQPWRLPGHYEDEETGLYYATARYYDPKLGRFVNEDPLLEDGGSFNLYLYCDGDPVNFVDPEGEMKRNNAQIGKTTNQKLKTRVTSTATRQSLVESESEDSDNAEQVSRNGGTQRATDDNDESDDAEEKSGDTSSHASNSASESVEKCPHRRSLLDDDDDDDDQAPALVAYGKYKKGDDDKITRMYQDKSRAFALRKEIIDDLSDEEIEQLGNLDVSLEDLQELEKLLDNEDVQTLAGMEVNGKKYFAMNGWGDHNSSYDELFAVDKMGDKTVPFFRGHAEGGVSNMAAMFDPDIKGKKAKLVVNRKLCNQCGSKGGVLRAAKTLGLSELELIIPGQPPLHLKAPFEDQKIPANYIAKKKKAE